APAPAPAPAPPSSAPAYRTWGFIVGGVGLGAIATGTVFALIAKSKNDDASRSCAGHACTDPRALTLTDEASSAARVADVAFIAGGVFLAVGGALVYFAPSPRGVTISGNFQ